MLYAIIDSRSHLSVISAHLYMESFQTEDILPCGDTQFLYHQDLMEYHH